MLLGRTRALGYTKLYLKPIPTWKKTLDIPSCVLSQVKIRWGGLNDESRVHVREE